MTGIYKIRVQQPKIPENADVILTRHAELRRNERHISMDEIKDTMIRPEVTFMYKNGALKSISKIEGREIKVVFKNIEKGVLIITVSSHKLLRT